MHKILKALGLLPARVMPKTFKELQSYPERPERDDNAEYEAAHHQLVRVEKHPCYWCGKTVDEVEALGDSMETHHFGEQSLWGAFIVWKVYADLKRLDFHGHAKDLPENPADLHANHIANLVNSCTPCHRENGYGIHGATMPFVWSRRWLKPGMDVLQRWKPMHAHLKKLFKR